MLLRAELQCVAKWSTLHLQHVHGHRAVLVDCIPRIRMTTYECSSAARCSARLPVVLTPASAEWHLALRTFGGPPDAAGPFLVVFGS